MSPVVSPSATPASAPGGSPLLAGPQRVVDGFGRSQRAASRYLVPRTVGELGASLARAASEGVQVAFRGAGRSYGDAALNAGQLLVDTRQLNRLLAWDPVQGVAEVEAGLSIGELWRHTLPDGFWPAVVPGTMAPTLGGCLSANIHGKNNFRVGPIGDQVLDFDLLAPDGQTYRCSRTENPDLFHAAIGGFGALGAFTRIKLRLKKVASGLLRVEGIRTRTLNDAFEVFEERAAKADYLVGWIDGLTEGEALGRGVLHQASYLAAEEDREGSARTLAVARQDLPATILGFPRRLVWRLMRPFMTDLGMSLMNLGRYAASALHRPGHSILQSHAAFAFLLDYVPDWRFAYGSAGFIQIQPFVPAAAAREVLREILERCQRAELPPYLVVLKRHRPDPFLLTHGLDGYSFAMDFPVHDRERLWALGREIVDLTLAAGGKFYFAKDSILRPGDAERAYGQDRVEAFFALKRRVDPAGLLRSDLFRRVFPDRFSAPEAR